MNSFKTFLQVSYLAKVPVITFWRFSAYEADMDWEGWAGSCGHSAALLVLGQHGGAHASTEGEHLFWNLGRKHSPPTHTALQLSPGVMGDEDVSCHSIQNRVSLNPVLLSAERPAAGPPPPRVDKHPGTSPLASPCLGCEQANLSPSCFIYTWCLLPLTWILTLRVGGISRKTTFVVCRWFPVSPPLSLSFSRLQELLNGTSWTPNTLG